MQLAMTLEKAFLVMLASLQLIEKAKVAQGLNGSVFRDEYSLERPSNYSRITWKQSLSHAVDLEASVGKGDCLGAH